jgi:hypothetical protein
LVYWWKKSKCTDRKGRDRWRAKLRACHVIFFDMKGIVHKEFVVAGHTPSSAYFGDKRDTPPHTSLFSREFLTKNIMTIITLLTWLCPLWLFSVFPIEDKTEWPPSWHNWGDWSRITGKLTTVTENDFYDAFKKVAEALGMVHTLSKGPLWGRW